MKNYYRLDICPEGFITIYRGGDVVHEFEFAYSSDPSWHLSVALEAFYDLIEKECMLEDCPPV